MHLIAGSIMILAASVLVAALWIGNVIHHPVVTDSTQANYLLILAMFLGIFGTVIVAIKLFSEFAGDIHRLDSNHTRK